MEGKIDKRNGGCGVIFENKLYVWGGESVDKYNLLAELSSEEEEEEGEGGGEKEEDEDSTVEIVVTLPRPDDPDHPFDVFNMDTHMWSRQPTYGDPPSLGLGSTLNVHLPSRCFYLFGGWNERQFDSEVYRVPVDTWVWEKVQPATTVKPSPRYLTGVVLHQDRLCMFGGVGPDIVRGQDPGARYQPNVENGVVREFGWNNEYYEFNMKTRTWTAPLGQDAFRPHPISTFAFSKCDRQRAILFGGSGSQGRMNEAFVFHLDTRIVGMFTARMPRHVNSEATTMCALSHLCGCAKFWNGSRTSNLKPQYQRKDLIAKIVIGSEWTGPIRPSRPTQPWPAKRRFGTLTPLIPPEMVGQRLCGCGPVLTQRMVLLWGKDTPHHICPETWLLDVETFTWVQINTGLKPRSWHIACAIYSPVTTECRVVVFGGNVHIKGHYGDRDNTADLRILSFGVKSLVKCCLAVIVESKEFLCTLPSLPPSFQKLITTAYEAYKNCPESFPITHVT